MSNKISQLKQPQPAPVLPPTQPEKPAFDVQAAAAYNAKSEQYFKNYENDIKRVLGTTADWKSEDFAKTVYDWQQKNGFSGKWVDGKFGPATMGKVSKLDPVLAKTYDAYAPWKSKHINEKPYKRVQDLLPEVDRIRREMGATDIPLNMLMGWIQVESGGNVNSRGLAELDERGLFQVSRDEANAIGANHDEIGSNQDASIRAGINLARYHANRIDQIMGKHPRMDRFFPKGSEMYWRLAMLSFSAGTGTAEALVARMDESGETFSNWDDVMKFAAANPHGFKHSPIKWSYHVNRAFNIGNQITGQQPAVANLKVQLRIKNAKRKARKLILNGIE